MVSAKRYLWAVLFLVAATLGVRAAFAQDVVVTHPVGMHGPDGVNCAHCHMDPHAAAGGDAARTTACQSCHGTAKWSPALFTVEQHETTAFPLTGRHKRVNCGLCHVNTRLQGLPQACNECHVDRHRGKLGGACEECHSPDAFRPVLIVFDHVVRTGFPLDGPHTGLACDTCHQGARGQAMRLVQNATCATCHTVAHADFGPCVSCHTLSVSSFALATFDHNRNSAFALERRHSSQPCAACHPVAADMPDGRCQSCHTDPHDGQLSTVCADCHRPDRWRLVRFDHDRTLWPLKGRHFVTACVRCHAGERWIGLRTDCWECHATDLARAPKNVPAHVVGLSDCSDCHKPWSWR